MRWVPQPVPSAEQPAFCFGWTRPRIEREVKAAVDAGRRIPGAQVFINDHRRFALAAGAYGVYLGQEDLDSAELHALRRAGLRLA